MKNITVSIDEETHRLARIRAAEMETSVSALVRGYLRSLVDDGTGDSASPSARQPGAGLRRHSDNQPFLESAWPAMTTNSTNERPA